MTKNDRFLQGVQEVRLDTQTHIHPELFDVRDVGVLLNTSESTVRRLADAGKLPRPVKLGQLVRWRRAELLAWLEEGCPPVRKTRAHAR